MSKKSLWSTHKTEDDIVYLAQTDSDMVIYNLLEDIKCLKEDSAELSDRICKYNCRAIGTPIAPQK